ncbi:MAG: hypothetical protein ACI39R_04490 [Lachnospiraceae bacterium]
MDIEKWNKFTRTGSIFDYLEYTACTSEENELRTTNSDRNRSVGDAYGGLRQEDNDSYKGTR